MVAQLNEQDAMLFSVTATEYELPWTPLPEKDIAWKKRVWRDIDTRTAENKKISSQLASVLMAGVFSGDIKAYSAVDDRFSQVMSKEQLAAIITPGNGSVGVNPAWVVKYQVKEDWLYVPKDNKIIVRIVGIAAVVELNGDNGKIVERALFWCYYPDSRNYLAAAKVPGTTTTWDHLFQARDFASTIAQVSSPNGPVSYKKK